MSITLTVTAEQYQVLESALFSRFNQENDRLDEHRAALSRIERLLGGAAPLSEGCPLAPMRRLVATQTAEVDALRDLGIELMQQRLAQTRTPVAA